MTGERTTLNYYDARLLMDVFKDCQRSPGAYAHLRNLFEWGHYPSLVEAGYIEGVNWRGWDIYRITAKGCAALAMYAPPPNEAG